MKMVRRCSRPGCQSPAVATLTYVYAESTAVLGPLATYAEPHSYDLCTRHAERLTVPRGWDAVRLSLPHAEPAPSTDDLEALADAVREAARSPVPAPAGPRGLAAGDGARERPRGAAARPGATLGSAPSPRSGHPSAPTSASTSTSTSAAPRELDADGRPTGIRRGHLRVLSNEP